MRAKPTSWGKKEKQKVTKIPFTVCINGDEFTTSASCRSAAISNAAHRYAQTYGMATALVRWKISAGELECEVFDES